MKKSDVQHPIGKISLLFGVLLSFGAGNANASVMCGVFQGTSCNIPLYYMKFCRDITFNQPTCERLCQAQQPICKAQDFEPWVAAYSYKGIRGIRGDLQNHASEFDIDGNLIYMSEKQVRVCKKTPFGWMPLPGHPVKTCAKAKPADPSTCGAGTVFDATRKMCVVQDSSGGSGTVDFQTLSGHSTMLIATQNQHFGIVPSTSTDLNFNSVTADTTPAGLVQDTNNVTAGLDPGAIIGAFKPSSSNGGSKSSSGSSSGSSGGGAGFSANSGSGSSVGAASAVTGDAVFASNTFGSNSGYGAGGAANGGSAGGAGAGGSGGASWFGNSGAATAGGASGEESFGKDGANRSPASGGTLDIEDPANYFMMSDIAVSLFKRVTAQCRRKEKEFLLTTNSGL